MFFYVFFFQPIYVIALCLYSNWILLLKIPLHSSLYLHICVLTVGAQNCHVIEDVLGLGIWNCRSSYRSNCIPLILWWLVGCEFLKNKWDNSTKRPWLTMMSAVLVFPVGCWNDHFQSWVHLKNIAFNVPVFILGPIVNLERKTTHESVHGLLVCLVLFPISVRLGSTSTVMCPSLVYC